MSAVTGEARAWLRLEGLAEFIVAVWAYASLGRGWLLFAACFLLPDVSFSGYLAGPRVGARVYNVAHSTVGPLLLLAFSRAEAGSVWTTAGLIWLAHVGIDRALGYGLKYPTAFTDTHFGSIGRRHDR